MEIPSGFRREQREITPRKVPQREPFWGIHSEGAEFLNELESPG